MSRRIEAGHAAYLTLNGAIVAFLLLPIAVVGIFALNPTPYIAFPPVGVSLRWFSKFFSSAEFMNALWLSLRVAGIVVVLSTVIGALCALASLLTMLGDRLFASLLELSLLGSLAGPSARFRKHECEHRDDDYRDDDDRDQYSRGHGSYTSLSSLAREGRPGPSSISLGPRSAPWLPGALSRPCGLDVCSREH